jgi:hypothetical protein
MLKISADFFGSLELTLSAQPPFENFKELGLYSKLSNVGTLW